MYQGHLVKIKVTGANTGYTSVTIHTFASGVLRIKIQLCLLTGSELAERFVTRLKLFGDRQSLKTPFCVPADELLQTKDDLLSEGGQSL